MTQDIEVQKTDFGCVIFDSSVHESVAIELEDVPKLIRDLQELLPIEFNHVAMPEPHVDWKNRFDIGVDRASLFVDGHAVPIFTLPIVEDVDLIGYVKDGRAIELNLPLSHYTIDTDGIVHQNVPPKDNG